VPTPSPLAQALARSVALSGVAEEVVLLLTGRWEPQEESWAASQRGQGCSGLTGSREALSDGELSRLEELAGGKDSGEASGRWGASPPP